MDRILLILSMQTNDPVRRPISWNNSSEAVMYLDLAAVTVGGAHSLNGLHSMSFVVLDNEGVHNLRQGQTTLSTHCKKERKSMHCSYD